MYEVDLYRCDKNSKLISLEKSGKLRPFKERSLSNKNFLFLLTPNIDEVLYIRVVTQSSMQVPISIQTSESLIENSQLSLMFSGMYYGLFVLIFFYNFISFLYTKTRKYLYYLLFISSFIMYQLSLDGVGVAYLWSNWTWMIDKGVSTFMGLMVLFVILFSREFLSTKERTPRVDKVLLLMVSILTFVTLIAPFVEYKYLIKILAFHSFLLPVILLGTGIYIYKKYSFRPARFYILGWGSFLFGSSLFAMNKFAWIDGYDFLAYAQQVGSALEMVFLSLSLADYQKQSELAYIKKLDNLNIELKEAVDESLVQIRQNDQVLIKKSKLAAMGEMIEQIAHQWRQPLNTLALLNQNLYFKVQLNTIVKDDIEETHDKINSQLQYMSQTIDDFRNFSNPDKKRECFDVETAIQSSISLSEGSLKLAKIKTHVFSKGSFEIYGIKHELMQVIMNLIKNSYDAVLSKDIKDAWIKFFINEDGNKVILHVEDNAGGIPRDKISKIFDPYFSTKNNAEGTGVGLYMSKEIIKNMSGQMNVQNTELGVSFTIEIKKENKC